MLRRRPKGKASMCSRLRCAWQPNNRLQSCQMGPVLSGSRVSHVTRVIGTGNGWEWLGRGAEMKARSCCCAWQFGGNSKEENECTARWGQAGQWTDSRRTRSRIGVEAPLTGRVPIADLHLSPAVAGGFS